MDGQTSLMRPTCNWHYNDGMDWIDLRVFSTSHFIWMAIAFGSG